MSHPRWPLVFLLFASAAPVAAQSAAAGALEGSVTDAGGQVLPDVSVTLRNGATEERYETKTDVAGAFSFSLLPPGT